MRPKTIVLLVLLTLTAIVLLQNTEDVTLRLLFWKFTVSQILWTSLTTLIGFIAGFLVAKLYGPRHRGRI